MLGAAIEGTDTQRQADSVSSMEDSERLTCVQVGQVWVLNIGVMILQVVAELHRRVGAEGALGTVVHFYALVFARMKNVLADVLSTVGSDGRQRWRGACVLLVITQSYI